MLNYEKIKICMPYATATIFIGNNYLFDMLYMWFRIRL